MTTHLSALGFTLIHFCWQAALIAGLYKLVEVSVPKLRSPERYLMGLVAMVAMLVMAIGTFVYEDIRLANEPTLVALAAPYYPATTSGNMTMEGLLPWLDGAWLLGVAALSLRMLGGLWFLNRLTAAAEAVPETVAQRFAVLMQRAGLKHVRIRLHARIDGPFVIGALRSVVYLPVSALTALSPDQLDAVLAHELEHIRRADYLWNLVQSAIETLFFFHPAVWWLGSRLREQRELCCDDAAVTMCRDPLTYATALLNLEEQRRARRVAGMGLAMALNGQDSGKSLVSRIARVLGERTTGTPKDRPPAVYALPAVLLILAAFFAPGAQVAAQAAKALATGEESAAALMDDTTASSVAASVHTPDIVKLSRSKAKDEAGMAMAAARMIWSGDKSSWKRVDGEWQRQDDDQAGKEAWKQEKADWKDQQDKDWKAAQDEWAKNKDAWKAEQDAWQNNADWQHNLADQVALARNSAMSERDRQNLERDVRDGVNITIAYEAKARSYADNARDYDRIPAPPSAPIAPRAPEAPAARPAPMAAPAPVAPLAPPAPAAPRPAPVARPAPAPQPAPAAPIAPVAPIAPKVVADYSYKAATDTQVNYKITPVHLEKTVDVTIPPDTVATSDTVDADLSSSPFVMHIDVKVPGRIVATARAKMQ